jgi:serine/threonine protein kinase
LVNENTNSNDIDVKLIDFGTAKKINGKINLCKNLVGTTSYMAPEIIDNYFN